MLTTLMGSRLRAKALVMLFTHPDNRYYVRQLTVLLNEDSTNLSRELARLAKTGLLVSVTEGKQKYYQANHNSPIYKELHNLITRLQETMPDSLSQRVAIPEPQLKAFCRRHHIRSLSLFGSVLRDDFKPESDIDILVEFQEGKTPGLLKLAGMEEELGTLLGGRKVDLRTSRDLSPHFRERVLQEARELCR
jgi:uncharacterized protein